MSEEREEQVGSLGEEAAKLISALQGWAREHGEDYANAAAAAASGAAASMDSINEHVATGSQECKYCPICQVISAVRETNPEAKQHLSSAAVSLLQAASRLLDTGPPPDRRGSSPVEKIDLTDDGTWDGEDP